LEIIGSKAIHKPMLALLMRKPKSLDDAFKLVLIVIPDIYCLLERFLNKNGMLNVMG
jgi:hypothetical protein